jgi:hypothetical protein
MASFAYADNCAVATGTVVEQCSTRTLYDNLSGYGLLDTINWGSNTVGADNSALANLGGSYTGTTYGYNPTAFGPGWGIIGLTGGANGTGYTIGQNVGAGGTTTLSTTGSAFGLTGLPNSILTTSEISSSSTYDGFAMTFDTSDESGNLPGLVTAQGAIDYRGAVAGVTGCSPAYDSFYTNGAADCATNPLYVAGTQSVNGVGFDFSLGVDTGTGLNQSADGFSVTFSIYGYQNGCNGGVTDIDSTLGGASGVTAVDCFDYANGQVTDPAGNDLGAGYGLLGTVTLTSDTSGDPVFFGVSSTTAISAIAVTAINTGSSEGAPVSFGIDNVGLLTQEQSTPEPATLLLFGSGLLFAARRLRKATTK